MIGRHLLIDFHDVSAGRLDDAELLSRLLAEAARRGGLTPLGPRCSIASRGRPDGLSAPL
ncbi:MAG: hypothetical protein WKF75_10270 [Singulisphaera sp.]